jgi:uncharacterized integral membrane protein
VRTLWLLVLVGLAVAVFAVQNAAPAPIAFLGWRGALSLSLLAVFAFALGAAAAAAATLPARWRDLRRIRQLQQQLADAEGAGRPADAPPQPPSP